MEVQNFCIIEFVDPAAGVAPRIIFGDEVKPVTLLHRLTFLAALLDRVFGLESFSTKDTGALMFHKRISRAI